MKVVFIKNKHSSQKKFSNSHIYKNEIQTFLTLCKTFDSTVSDWNV